MVTKPLTTVSLSRKEIAMPDLKSIEVSLNLPWGLGGVKGTWAPDEHERDAAWEMYVELITRVAVEELGPGEGLLREALTSLYSLFQTTRGILREHGPSVARAKGGGDYSFGQLAVIILNEVLRPLLAKWHPLLSDWESRRPSDVSQLEHERRWPENAGLREELDAIRPTLSQYAAMLADAARVPRLGALSSRAQ
jgi:hypothetical protein